MNDDVTIPAFALLKWSDVCPKVKRAIIGDTTYSFTNNLAERDLRMMKVQQKISGTFRSAQGITAFCALRSYLSTMRKQGRPLLASLRAVFAGSPFSIAWEPGT